MNNFWYGINLTFINVKIHVPVTNMFNTIK